LTAKPADWLVAVDLVTNWAANDSVWLSSMVWISYLIYGAF